MDDKYWLKMSENGDKVHLYELMGDNPRDDVSAAHIQKTQEMKTLTNAIHKTVQYMLHTNTRENLKD